MRRSILFLLLLSALTFFVGLGRPAITDADEAYYAEAAREMVVTGDWLTPHFNFENRWQKPVLYYWLTAMTYEVAGINEGAARFWSALAGLGLVLLTASMGRQYVGARAGWLAGAIVATSYGCVALARMALPDLPLAFCITLSIWATLRALDVGPRAGGGLPTAAASGLAWWSLAGLGAGLGFLMKGPVAIALPALVLAGIWWRDRPSLRPHARGLTLAALVAAAVGLPWYVAMVSEHGVAYLRSFFVGDNLERFATGRFNGPRSWLFYAPILLGGFIPWTAFLVALPVSRLAQVWRRRAPISPGAWRLLLWAMLPLVFYTVSIGKQPRYILPVLPPVAALLAARLLAEVRDARAGRSRALAIATWATAALLVLAAVLLLHAQPLFIVAYAWATRSAAVALLLAAAVLAAIALTRTWTSLPAAMVAVSVVLLLGVQFGALAGRRPEAVERVADLVVRARPVRDGIAVYGAFGRNLGFYTGEPRTEVFDDTQAAAFLSGAGRRVLVTTLGAAMRLEDTQGLMLRTLGAIPYFNAANLRLGTLLSPDPVGDLDTVVVVTNAR